MPKNLPASEIKINDKLPELRIAMTAQHIISAAAATRDWQPIHHDHEVAIKSGLRGIILNAPSQTGWIAKYITDWAGPHAEIKRLAFKMKDSICPGDTMTINGDITGKEEKPDHSYQITANIIVSAGEKIKTNAEVCFNIPA